MSQRKKTPTLHQSQKVLAAQYRKEFFRKMKLIIDAYCGKNIYPLIPQKTLDYIYLCRCTPFKFRADYNSNISPKILTDSKVILTSLIKKTIITLPANNLEIPLTDYYTVLFTIVSFQSFIQSTDFVEAQKVKDALHVISSNLDTEKRANELMYGILYSFNLGESDLRKIVYWYKHDMVMPQTLPSETGNVIIIYSSVPKTISVEIDNISRPVLRVGWAFAYEGAKWLSLKPSALGINSPFAEIPLNVYIQSHALNRLSERIDCFWTGIIQLNMYISLLNPVIAYDSNKNILIEFTIFSTKLGYFRADIINGIILIRTFLFITNNSTPEGQLLEKNTGLQKLDKKYLALDKLSTFMTSDIGKNDEVVKILKTSGCQGLVDLYQKMNSLLTKKDNKFDTDFMLNYVNFKPFNISEISENSELETSITNM